MRDRINRREFIKGSASRLAGLAIGASALGRSSRVLGANDRLSIGVIGTGNRASDLIKQVARFSTEMNVEVTALCDVWMVNLKRAAVMVRQLFGRTPRTFVDFEDLLRLPDVDAVVIATPDFHRARMLTSAVRAGKDAYVEKPMAMELEEAKTAVRAVEETKRVVQVGTQRRSDGRFKAAAELMASGVLGTISRVEAAWNDCAPRWRRNTSSVKREDVDWDRYLGHLKRRPFDASFFREWQLYRECSIGTLSLLGSHMLDVVHWLMGDPLPLSAVALGGNFAWSDGRENHDTVYTLFEYPKKFLLRYCSGLGNSLGNGCFFFGTKGYFDTESWKLSGAGGGEGKMAEEIVVQPLAGEDHMKNFLDCIRSRGRPNADVYAGYGHSVASIIGDRALRTGRIVRYDIEKQEIREG